ncbi:unnamed protein product, partial [Mesorhabditis spiculigera]
MIFFHLKQYWSVQGAEQDYLLLDVHRSIDFENCSLDWQQPRGELANRISLSNEKSILQGLDSCRTEPNRLLLSYEKTLVVYDVSVREVLANWTLESEPMAAHWSLDGKFVTVASSDGSFLTFAPKGESLETPGIIFGPFPCQPVNKALSTTTHLGTLHAFSGGMPRASYGDRYTVTTIRTGRTECWDFASPVKDFCFAGSHTGQSSPLFLLVLTEEELVVLSVGGKEWRPIPLRCLFPLHASAVTTMTHVADIEEEVWDRLHKHSPHKRATISNWPLSYAQQMAQRTSEHKEQLLLTGHANGNVNLWTAGEASMQLLYCIETATEVAGCSERKESFTRKSLESDSEESECHLTDEWPPFRKVGDYDPCSDDVRLSVQRLAFDPKTGTIAVGCRGGHALVYQFCENPQTCDAASVLDCSLLKDTSGIAPAIRSLRGIEPRNHSLNFTAGYQPRPVDKSSGSLLVQLSPCVPITAIAIYDERSLLAVGTEFGFALIDYQKTRIIHQQSFLDNADLADAGALDDALNRFKSMKKSIRQSFRRKKKATSNDTTLNNEHEDELCRPVERRIEARGALTQGLIIEPSKGLVRLIKFVPNIALGHAQGDTVWIGTHGGRLYGFSLSANGECKLEREIRLQHAAPVRSIEVVTDPNNKNSPASRLLLITEEQVRGYTLPQLKPTKYKVKLTANEGYRINKGSLVTLRHTKGDPSSDVFLALITNMGGILVYSLHNHRKNAKFTLTKATDVAGINSSILSQYGEIFWLRAGASLLQRASLCAPEAPPPVPVE